MTSAVAIRRVSRPPSPKALSADDRKRIADICDDPKLIDEIKKRRLGVAVTPDGVATRDLLKTLAMLADKLHGAADALATLPEGARALLQEKLGGTQAQQTDLAMTLYNVAGCARASTMRVAPKSGRPADARAVYAVASARALCDSFDLPRGVVPDFASIILDTEISTEACKRALRLGRKLP